MTTRSRCGSSGRDEPRRRPGVGARLGPPAAAPSARPRSSAPPPAPARPAARSAARPRRTSRAARTASRSPRGSARGGARQNSAIRSAGFHQAVSTNRLGCSGITCHSHARSEIAAWARISLASGNSPLSATVSRPSAGMPAAGMDQDRDPPLVGERDEAAHGGLVEAELLGPRVQLDPAGAGVQARAWPPRRRRRAGRRGSTAPACPPTPRPRRSRSRWPRGSRRARASGTRRRARRRRRAPPAAAPGSARSRPGRWRRRACGRRRASRPPDLRGEPVEVGAQERVDVEHRRPGYRGGGP